MEGNSNNEKQMRWYYYNQTATVEGGSHRPSAVVLQQQPVKRKRGRPRKYGTPQLTPLPSNLPITTTTSSSSSPSKQQQQQQQQHASSASSSFSLGNAAQGFTPHVISVAPGEDVGQKIMFYMQQSRRGMCILSASGSISNASLLKPATVGGNITYEGRFEIISLSGSYVHNEVGGRSGGLTVCLSNTDGQIIGGGVVGPLKAAGPVKVIVGKFFIDTKIKDTGAGVKGNASAIKLPSTVGESMSSLSFHQTVDSSGGNPIRGNNEHQGIGGSHFMIQQLGLHVTPSRPGDWGARLDSRNIGYDLTGRTGHGGNQSPENGGYDQIPD